MRTTLIILFLSLFSLSVQASPSDALGTWMTIDDETNEPKSLVRLWIDGSELKGQVVEILNPAKRNDRCTKCKGDRKDQPIEGMTIIWSMERTEDGWEGGYILDPAKGKEYKALITPGDDGQTLEVRGYIGFSLIGRSQTWQRAE